jgi:hypothetical protein
MQEIFEINRKHIVSTLQKYINPAIFGVVTDSVLLVFDAV